MNPANEKIFWYTLVIFSLVWILLTVINVFKLDITQITICLFCGVMLIFNLYNYYRCSKAQKDNVEKLKRQYGPQALGEYMAGSIIANYF